MLAGIQGLRLFRVARHSARGAWATRFRNTIDRTRLSCDNAAMKRRIIILSLAFVALVGIVLGVVGMLPPRAGVTKANVDRIEKGMTKAEAQEIIGRPATGQINWPIANDVLRAGIFGFGHLTSP